MDNIKISVSFSIPGSVAYQEKDNNGDPIRYNTVSIPMGKSAPITIKVAKCKPSTQSINMTDEAYKGMLSTPIHKISLNHWKRMTDVQRVAEHLKDIQYDLHATSFEFTIYED